MTWLATPPDAPFSCSICARPASAGPFWIGPRIPTGQAGFGAGQRGRVKVCADCWFVGTEEPDSPFHGLIPAGRTAVERVAELEELNAGLLVRLREFEAHSGQPAGVARVAAEAALAVCEERGFLVKERA